MFIEPMTTHYSGPFGVLRVHIWLDTKLGLKEVGKPEIVEIDLTIIEQICDLLWQIEDFGSHYSEDNIL